MKKKRGRPSEKSFPEPPTLDQGFDNAVYGKVGASEGMAFVRGCPYPTVEYIEKMSAKKRSRAEKEFLKRGNEFAEKWAIRIGPLLGRKIITGDGRFFHDVAVAVEECCKENRPITDFRRYLAIQCREECLTSDTPFTSKGLRNYCLLHNPGDKLDSSTLARLMKWVRSAGL